MPPKTRYARSGETQIAYQVFGEGEIDLMISPGFISHLEMWWMIPEATAFLRRLGSFARVIAYDKRGTGLSDPSAGAPTIDERMQDLHAVLDAAESERPAIFGYSEGGQRPRCCSPRCIRSVCGRSR
jgi:pimeloyl-ACP methyl ester carboxylesterase